MAKIKGMGGYWFLSETPDGKLVNKQIHNATYTLEVTEELHETRSAGCAGWCEGLPVIKRVDSATFSVPEDDASFLDALGFTEGQELSVWLRRGSTSTFDYLQQTVVQAVRVTNDQQKARRIEVACRYGRLLRQVPAPAPPPPIPPAQE